MGGISFIGAARTRCRKCARRKKKWIMMFPAKCNDSLPSRRKQPKQKKKRCFKVMCRYSIEKYRTSRWKCLHSNQQPNWRGGGEVGCWSNNAALWLCVWVCWRNVNGFGALWLIRTRYTTQSDNEHAPSSHLSPSCTQNECNSNIIL